MRLWSIHPQYLDTKEFVACWKDAIDASAIIKRDDRNIHKIYPQLSRFNDIIPSKPAINKYLMFMYYNSIIRGYRFKHKNIDFKEIEKNPGIRILVTRGQLNHELKIVRKILEDRDSELLDSPIYSYREVEPNPMFMVITGGIEQWEVL